MIKKPGNGEDIIDRKQKTPIGSGFLDLIHHLRMNVSYQVSKLDSN